MVCKKNISEVLNNLNEWNKAQDSREAIKRDFKFKDFKLAFSFLTLIAMKAEEINHHPEIENVYNKVSITLTTHDLNGISDKDEELGMFIDKIYKSQF
tara:strand:+ start:32 stop:325 length:294 start_codon:yes stop_codon:yes gene_type:complete